MHINIITYNNTYGATWDLVGVAWGLSPLLLGGLTGGV